MATKQILWWMLNESELHIRDKELVPVVFLTAFYHYSEHVGLIQLISVRSAGSSGGRAYLPFCARFSFPSRSNNTGVLQNAQTPHCLRSTICILHLRYKG